MRAFALVVVMLTAIAAIPAGTAAKPFICFVSLNDRCAAGYDTPPAHDSCDMLPRGTTQREELFVNQSAAVIVLGHTCGTDADGKKDESTYVGVGGTRVTWGVAATPNCQIVMTNEQVPSQASTPCPARLQPPDLLP